MVAEGVNEGDNRYKPIHRKIQHGRQAAHLGGSQGDALLNAAQLALHGSAHVVQQVVDDLVRPHLHACQVTDAHILSLATTARFSHGMMAGHGISPVLPALSKQLSAMVRCFTFL